MESNDSKTGELSTSANEAGRDEDFWFVDGSIVLVAQTVAFKVHHSVLARNSEVFRDLFAMPQPLSEETMDGCPMLIVHDSPSEIRYLLGVLYDGRRFYMDSELCQFEFPEVEALVKLAHKYQIDDLREHGVTRLKTAFTDDFELWNSRTSFSTAAIHLSENDYIPAVNLARLIGATYLLPVAFYLCCQLSTAQLLQGTPRPDGTTARLTADDLERCIEGKHKLVQDNTLGNAKIFARAAANCTTSCDHRLLGLIMHRHWLPDASTLANADAFIERLCMDERLCGECGRHMKAVHLQHRRDAWNLLPRTFGLGNWLKLRGQSATSQSVANARGDVPLAPG